MNLTRQRPEPADDDTTTPEPTATKPSGYGRGAKILSIGIASTGIVTFAYFSLASYALSDTQYKQISLLWTVMFIILSVIYRPIEQLLSRSISKARSKGSHHHQLRVPLVLQLCFCLLFVVLSLLLRKMIVSDLFSGNEMIFWVLFAGVVAYSASYFTRGWLAGHQMFGLYGGLVFMEANSRVLFALTAVIGIVSGQTWVALGIAAAPIASLAVVPLAFRLRKRDNDNAAASAIKQSKVSLRHGGSFTASVAVIMLSEQALLNAAVLTVHSTSNNPALAGYVFTALLIARAPTQLFQAIQGSLLPHLSGLDPEDTHSFSKAIRITSVAIAVFSFATAFALLIVGPFVMSILFDTAERFSAGGLALVAVGMGGHLIAGTLNQAALARNHFGRAAIAWLVTAIGFVLFMVSDIVHDQLLRAELGYCIAALALCSLLVLVYMSGSRNFAVRGGRVTATENG